MTCLFIPINESYWQMVRFGHSYPICSMVWSIFTNIYHQNDHFGVGKYSSTMEHLGMLNYHFGCRIMVSQRVIFGSRDARFPIYWVPVLSMWAPPVIRWFINPMNTIVMGIIKHIVIGVMNQLSYRFWGPLCNDQRFVF
jgi:hypothetical protein